MPFGFAITKSNEVNELKKSVNKLEVALLNRPFIDFQNSDVYSINYPKYPVDFNRLYDIYRVSDVLNNVVGSLRHELFRNGTNFEPAFVNKCVNEDCEKDFEFEVEKCDACGSEVKEPFFGELDNFKKFVKRANDNGQSLIEVLKSLNDDLEITDDCFLLLSKSYFFNPDGELVSEEIEELIRLTPILMDFVADEYGRLGFDKEGMPQRVCSQHRTELTDKLVCPHCELQTFSAHYVYNGEVKKYYAGSEVFHMSKYNPSLLRGYSILYSVWQKTNVLLSMDKLLFDWYKGQRMPRAMLTVNTSNQESLTKAWKQMLLRSREHPNDLFPLAIDNPDGKNSTQYVKLMDSLQEMTFIESRVQLIREIGAVYGVSPLFLNDTSSSGGLNNEGLQITVTNRAVEVGQDLYNSKLFPWLLHQFAVEDWNFVLNPSEEMDEMANLQRDTQKITNARGMLEMGFDVSISQGEEFDFNFSGEASDLSLVPSGNNFSNFSPSEDTFSGMPEVKELSKVEVKVGSKFFDGLDKDLQGLIRKLDRKTKLPQAEYKATVKKLVNKFSDKIVKTGNRALKKEYVDAIKDVENFLDVDIGFGDVDRNALQAIEKSRPLKSAYNNMNKKLSKELNSTIDKAFRGKDFSLQKLVDSMQEVVEGSEGSLERIARTESSNVRNLARDNSYKKADKRGEFKYKWIGPNDSRTSIYSKDMKSDVAREGGGVSLKRLKELVRKNGDQTIYMASRPFQTHINQRHTFVKVI